MDGLGHRFAPCRGARRGLREEEQARRQSKASGGEADATLSGMAAVSAELCVCARRVRRPPRPAQPEFGVETSAQWPAATQGWTLDGYRPGWTVFQIPSTPGVPTGRPIRPLRSRLGQLECVFLARPARRGRPAKPVTEVALETSPVTVCGGGVIVIGRVRRGAASAPASGEATSSAHWTRGHDRPWRLHGRSCSRWNWQSPTLAPHLQRARRGRDERGRLVVGSFQGRRSEDGGGVVTALGVRGTLLQQASSRLMPW